MVRSTIMWEEEVQFLHTSTVSKNFPLMEAYYLYIINILKIYLLDCIFFLFLKLIQIPTHIFYVGNMYILSIRKLLKWHLNPTFNCFFFITNYVKLILEQNSFFFTKTKMLINVQRYVFIKKLIHNGQIIDYLVTEWLRIRKFQLIKIYIVWYMQIQIENSLSV